MFFGFLDGYDSERWLTHYYFETAIIYLAATSSALLLVKLAPNTPQEDGEMATCSSKSTSTRSTQQWTLRCY